MFTDFDSLRELKIKNFSSKNLMDMSSMLLNCSSLKALPDIQYVTDLNSIFDMDCIIYSCLSLVSLPDISEWNASSVYFLR